MPTGNEAVNFDMMRYMREKLETEIAAVAGIAGVDSWQDVQTIVRAGLAAKVFSVGDQLSCQRDGVELVWDIIGIDHDTPADSQYTHSMTLQLHDCFAYSVQYDAAEAFYYAENGLAAGTYHFTMSGTDYQFTLNNAVPAGGQLVLNWSGNTPAGVSVASTKGGAITETSIAVTAGSGGSALDTAHINDFGKTQYGSNNYKESAIRQWLNSGGAAGAVWTLQNDYDRPPSWAASREGFLNGMDADFLSVIGNTNITVTKNTVSDGGGSETLADKFFLPSKVEVYMGNETSGVSEGTAYPYYSEHSDLGSPSAGRDSNRVKYRSGTALDWWTRTPAASNVYYVRLVYRSGSLDTGGANSGNKCVSPICCVI